jgi:hypothetical protein
VLLFALALPGSASSDRHRASLSRLAWRPPTLVDPITLSVSSAAPLTLDPARDYILKLPRDRPIIAGYGCIHIEGGHDIVLIGGECYVPKQQNPTEGSGRVFYLEGNTGTVHIEGLYADGPGLTEGIDVFRSRRTVLQVENCRFETIHNWGNSAIHSDLIQADTLAALRVDRFTGASQVQGIFRDGTSPAPRGVQLRHVNITGVAGGTPGRLLWNGSGLAGGYPMSLHDVYIRPFPGSSLGDVVWPPTGRSAELARRTRSGAVEWRAAAHIRGLVHPGRPPGGDMVPWGVAGLHYASPGYAGGRAGR